jgi:hypothetical protein
MCPRRPLIAHENAFYLAGLQMELVKCLPRHLAIDLGDAFTRSFSRSRHRFVAISNCDGVSADAVFVAVARNVDLNHPTDRHGGLPLKRHHSKSLSVASLWPDGLSPDGAKNHPHRLRGGRATLIRANVVGPRLASPPSRRIKPDTKNSRSARLYRQFSFCCRRRSLACSCRQRLIFARDLHCPIRAVRNSACCATPSRVARRIFVDQARAP